MCNAHKRINLSAFSFLVPQYVINICYDITDIGLELYSQIFQNGLYSEKYSSISYTLDGLMLVIN